MTQVLTGHGCFGEYLCRIKRERTTRCHYCRKERDTAQHTLAECPEWEELRRTLVGKIGPNLSLPVVATKMIGNEECWKAVASFCEQAMSQKEAAERIRRQVQAAEEAAAAAAEATSTATESETDDGGGVAADESSEKEDGS